MGNDSELGPTRYSEVSSYSGTERNVTAMPFGHLLDRVRAKNVAERRLLVSEFRSLAIELEGLSTNVESLRKAHVRAKNIDTILESEERKVLAELDKGETVFLQTLHLSELKLMTEILEAELKHEDAQQRLDRKRTPPQRDTPRDTTMDTLKDIFNGGGRYTRAAKEMEEELIRKRGGKHNLQPEDNETIRNAYHHASKADQSKG